MALIELDTYYPDNKQAAFSEYDITNFDIIAKGDEKVGSVVSVLVDDSLIRYLTDEGYKPQFGARELRRQIRQQVETKLAAEILRGDLGEEDTVTVRYDAPTHAIAFDKASPVPSSV